MPDKGLPAPARAEDRHSGDRHSGLRPFADRRDAGRQLACRLVQARVTEPRVVVALPRGGVPVAFEVARALQAPLEPLIVRKIGAPGQPELAVAALADGLEPEVFIDERRCAATGADAAYLQAQTALETTVIRQRRRDWGLSAVGSPLGGSTVVLVDDGVATGTTVRAALQALRRRGATRIVLAVPVAPPESLRLLRGLCDQVICLIEPAAFRAVGEHYRDFRPVDEGEVCRLLRAGGSDA